MKKILLIYALLLAGALSIKAQVTTEPDPVQEDSRDIVIYFHADQGNKGLINMPADTHLYAHTGVLLSDAKSDSDWKYAPSWEENDDKYRLEYVSDNLWKLNIGDISSFYGVQPNETVTRLAFVFRDAGGKKTGKTADNGDIFVDVSESGFQLAFRQSRSDFIVNSNPTRKFTATTTEPADKISIYVGDQLIGEEANVKSFAASYTFSAVGDYVVKAVATKDGKSRERSISLVYAREPRQLSGTIPPLGLTKSGSDYIFTFAAPQKESVVLLGSWNGYVPTNAQVMDYYLETIEGVPFKYFSVKMPAATTGNKFGYFFQVDGKYSVGDPYARLVLDPYNDKYISETAYPDMPQYPSGLEAYTSGSLPAGTMVAWHADNLLDYKWNVKSFKGAAKDNLVIYELLFRDFTGTEGAAKGNGTVRAAIEKLPYLKQLGINAIELLPINEFNGNNSWGYNPNFYFAIDKAYGTPADYKEFIDKCHELGIAVILDVVFNQSDGLHPWYKMYSVGANPFYNATAPHAFSVLNDWNQGYPLVERQWKDMLQFWLSEYKVDGFRFDLVKGLGDNTSYANSGDSATSAYNESRVARMKRLHDAMREVNPDAYFINENLAGAKEENEMAADGELNWANINDPGCQFAMGYQSNASLNRMWAKNDSRTPGSTVAYLESHDEQRLAYKQNQWGVAGVKGNHKVSMQRCGSAAAQMILAPGSHMIWMFSEMGNAQNTKDNNGGNNTSPKIVNWALLDDPDNAGLVKSYQELINLRLSETELFAPEADYSMNFTVWNTPRYMKSKAGDKEVYAVINCVTNASQTYTFASSDFAKGGNSSYRIFSKSFGSNPTFDAAAKTVTVEPGCYVVITSANVTGVDEMEYTGATNATRIYSEAGEIRVVNCNGPVNVYTIDGANVASASGDAAIQVTPGTYVVRADGTTAKIIVR